MSAYIYIEGGAKGPNSNYLRTRCQEAFRTLLDKMGIARRHVRLKACGGRNSVYEDFCTAHQSRRGDFVAIWIDSEEPMTDIEQAWQHLASVTTVTRWERPSGAVDDQVLFMTTCMETWLVADRSALRTMYRAGLNENPLPHSDNLEARQRHDVQRTLVSATRNCRNPYSKGKHSFELLEMLDPTVLEQHLPSFGRVKRILTARLRNR